MANVVDGAEKFRGSMVALVTPHNRDGSIDYGSMRNLIDWQIAGGTDVIVPCGTTGESATLSPREHDLIIERVVEHVNGRVPVLAGTGSNNTREAIARTAHARKVGADGALVIEPYYNKPPEEFVVEEYFGPIAKKNQGFPLAAYHVPGRTQGKLSIASVIKLAEMPEYIGIKEASGDMARACEIVHHCGDDLALFSGEDALNFAMYCIGGKGAISVTANAAPNLVARVWDCFSAGKIAKARECQDEILPLNKVMFEGYGNPGCVKTALYLMARIQPYARAPIGLAHGKTVANIANALASFRITTPNYNGNPTS